MLTLHYYYQVANWREILLFSWLKYLNPIVLANVLVPFWLCYDNVCKNWNIIIRIINKSEEIILNQYSIVITLEKL